jgi:hypothetical protein
MQTAQVQFGSRTGNRFLRILQGLFAPFALGLAGDPRSVSYWFYVVLLVGFEFHFSQFVFATLNENGLVYQRWTKSIRVDWGSFEVPKQEWAFLTLIKLYGKPFWSRYLLLPNPSPSLHELALSSQAAERLEDLMLIHTSGRTN